MPTLANQIERDSRRVVAHDVCLGCDSAECCCAPIAYAAGDLWEPSIEQLVKMYPPGKLPYSASERRRLGELFGWGE